MSCAIRKENFHAWNSGLEISGLRKTQLGLLRNLADYTKLLSMAATLFGTRLTTRQQELSMSREQVAEFFGIDPSTLSRWINGGQKPGSERYVRIAEFLDIEVAEVAGLIHTQAHAGTAEASATANDATVRTTPVETETRIGYDTNTLLSTTIVERANAMRAKMAAVSEGLTTMLENADPAERKIATPALDALLEGTDEFRAELAKLLDVES